jgi:hypothetical protein
MNTAFHDGLNLAWKIHLIETGFADRSILSTYESERRKIAKELLDFDHEYATLFSGGDHNADEGAANAVRAGEDNMFVKTFKNACEFTSGYGIYYPPNQFNISLDDAQAFAPSSCRLVPGRTLPQCTVIRVLDLNPIRLEQAIPLTGGFKIFIFGGDLHHSGMKRVEDLCGSLLKPSSFYMKASRATSDSGRGTGKGKSITQTPYLPDTALISLAAVFDAPRPDIDLSKLPAPLQRYPGTVFVDTERSHQHGEVHGAVHKKYGVEEGAVVVCRPDGYVGCVLKLVEGRKTGEELQHYFDRFMPRGKGKL